MSIFGFSTLAPEKNKKEEERVRAFSINRLPPTGFGVSRAAFG